MLSYLQGQNRFLSHFEFGVHIVYVRPPLTFWELSNESNQVGLRRLRPGSTQIHSKPFLKIKFLSCLTLYGISKTEKENIFLIILLCIQRILKFRDELVSEWMSHMHLSFMYIDLDFCKPAMILCITVKYIIRLVPAFSSVFFQGLFIKAILWIKLTLLH